MTELTSLNIEVKPDEEGVLTFYVDGEPQGIVKDIKCNCINGKWAYPIECEILHSKGHLVILKGWADKLSVESKPVSETIQK